MKRVREVGGPMRVVNQMPLQLLFLQPFPDLAATAPRGHFKLHWNTAVTNTLIREAHEGAGIYLDLEMLRSVIDLRLGATRWLELGLELPVLYTYDGVLDSFIRGIERAYGRESQRRQRYDDTYEYRFWRRGDTLLEVEQNSLGIGDLVLKMKGGLLTEGAVLPALSLRAALKLPTGDEHAGRGSGAADAGLGLLAQKSFWICTLYLNGDLIFPGRDSPLEGLSPEPFPSGMAALELTLLDSLSLVGQYRVDHLALFGHRTSDGILGLNWAPTRRLGLQVGVAENWFGEGGFSSDVSFFLNLTKIW